MHALRVIHTPCCRVPDILTVYRSDRLNDKDGFRQHSVGRFGMPPWAAFRGRLGWGDGMRGHDTYFPNCREICIMSPYSLRCALSFRGCRRRRHWGISEGTRGWRGGWRSGFPEGVRRASDGSVLQLVEAWRRSSVSRTSGGKALRQADRKPAVRKNRTWGKMSKAR